MVKKFSKKPTVEGLVWAKKCLDCQNDCKIELLPKSELISCPDFKSMEEV